MNVKATLTLKALALGALLAASAGASAQQAAGTWAVSVGINNISPHATDALSAPSIPGSETKPGSDAEPVVNIIYNFDDHISAMLGLGNEYKHDLYGAGSLAGAGKLGTLKQLPPTLFAQYHFLDANAPVRPYVGLGITYAMFRDEKGSGTLTAISNPGGSPTTFKVDNAWGETPQLGVTWNVNQRWFVDAWVAKTYISTTVHLSTGQSANAPLNPTSEAITVGYRF
ncbi:MAG TPA: OmpW family outer membrane protein [Burkholderiaceae bacterium]